ncbi:hypothetical protein [Stenotrophomonas geniculata]|uniref:hypothetical protein n=1 Tax=Stenotrophomonas geniculata TaxID=86188 RepID=UPI002E78871E|nr:hypothetical protein [Stenotrophomonas geniculata]
MNNNSQPTSASQSEHVPSLALKRLNAWAAVILLAVAASVSILSRSWSVLWAFCAVAVAIEVLASIATRLFVREDRPLTVGDLRSLDRVLAGVAVVAMTMGLLGIAERYIWFNTEAPASLLVQSDHRDTALTEDEYRLFAWECEAKFGRGPVEVRRAGSDSYVRCGGIWPGVRTLAAKTEQYEKASKAYWKDPNAPATIPLSK